MLAALALAAALQAPQPATSPAQAAAAGPPLQVQYDSAENRYRDNKTVLTGNPVVLTRGDAVLVCKKLTFDNDEKGELQKATCEGDVKLTRGERVVTCLIAVYEAASARVVCRGDVQIRDARSSLTAEELTYDLDENLVTLTRGKGALYEEPGKGLPLGRRGQKP